MNRIEHSRDAALLDHGREGLIAPDRFVVQPQEAHSKADTGQQHHAAGVRAPDDSVVHVHPILLGF
jgi:hypothetical protein